MAITILPGDEGKYKCPVCNLWIFPGKKKPPQDPEFPDVCNNCLKILENDYSDVFDENDVDVIRYYVQDVQVQLNKPDFQEMRAITKTPEGHIALQQSMVEPIKTRIYASKTLQSQAGRWWRNEPGHVPGGTYDVIYNAFAIKVSYEVVGILAAIGVI